MAFGIEIIRAVVVLAREGQGSSDKHGSERSGLLDNRALACARHHVDRKVIHVEALHVGIGLTCADRLDVRGVVGHAVHAHLVAVEVRVEEAHVHGSLGLNGVSVLVEQRHVDSHGILEHLALILDGLGHGLDDIVAFNLRRLDRRAFGQNAFAGGHFDDDAVDKGIALEGGAAHIGNDFNGFSRPGGFGLLVLRLLFVVRSYHGVGRDGIGSISGCAFA